MKFILFLAIFTGCANLFENRSFITEMDHESDPFFVPGQDFNSIPGDSGLAHRSRADIKSRTPASAFDSKQDLLSRSVSKELKNKESRLNTRDRNLYRRVLPHFESESEKIYFLNLSEYEREEYLQARNIELPYQGQFRGRSRSIASLDPKGLSDRALVLGMNKREVMNYWGNPSRVEVAGNPALQNEKWSFMKAGRPQVVYFEGGVVQGWQLQ